MPIKLYDTKDAVPDALRDGALETKDGKFAVVEEVDTTDLKTALDAERTKRVAAEKLSNKTAADLKELETKTKAAKAGITDEQLTTLRAEMRKDLETEYAPFKTDAEKFKTENRTLKLDNAVKAVMGSDKVKVRSERMEALWTLIGGDFDLTDDGKPMVKSNPGLTPEKYLAETVKQRFPEFYVGTQAAGGGANGSQRSTNGTAQLSSDEVLKNPGAALQRARAEGKTE